MPLRFGCLLLFFSSNLAAAEPESPLAAAARQREAAIRSVEFVCRVKQTILRGALGTVAQGEDGKFNPDARRPMPAADSVTEAMTRLVFDGSRSRLEDEAPRLGHLTPLYELAVQNDREQRVLFGYLSPTKQSRRERMAGVSKPTPTVHYAQLAEPVVLACRWSGHTHLSGTPPTPTGTNVTIDGAACEGYRLDKTQTLWADARQGYLVRRIEESKSGLTTRCDIRYQDHPGVGALPARWTWTQHAADGHLRSTVDVTAEALHTNERFADGLFELKFPPGTSFVRDGRQYRVADDGEEVSESPPDPPTAPPKPAWEPNGDQKLGLAAVAVGAAALIGWRWRSVRQPA